MKWSWKRWKLGLYISIGTGLFTGVIGLGAGMTWKGALMLIAASVGKDFVLYQSQHPVDSIELDEEPAPAGAAPKPAGQNDIPK